MLDTNPHPFDPNQPGNQSHLRESAPPAFQVGDIGTAQLGGVYQFKARPIVKILPGSQEWHYFFDEEGVGWPESQVVPYSPRVHELDPSVQIPTNLELHAPQKGLLLAWACHYIERGARLTFFKGQQTDDKGKTQPKPFWDALPKENGKPVYWVNASIEYVCHMLDIGADGMKVNASDLAKSQALEDLGISLIRQGVRLAPIGSNKKAFWKCFEPIVKVGPDYTTSETWNGVLDAHWAAGPTTIEQLTHWIDCGAPALGALCGEMSDSLYIFDIDVTRFLDKFKKQEGVESILTRHKVPVMVTGGGGYQLWLKVNGKVPPNTKYAWSPDPSAKEGRTVAIESRGPQKGYGLTVHSLHPSGAYYRETDLFGGSFDRIPTISEASLEVLEAAARAICEAPTPIKAERPDMSGRAKVHFGEYSKPKTHTKAGRGTLARRGQKLSEIRQEEVQTKTFSAREYIINALDQARNSGHYSGRRDVINVVNEVLDVTRVLERYGYMLENNGRYSHPDAVSGSGVSIQNNRSIHHSTNDRLHYDNELTGEHNPTGIYRTRTPFDVICAYSFSGNRKRAVKELAKRLGIAYQGRRPVKPVEDDFPVPPSSPPHNDDDDSDEHPPSSSPPPPPPPDYYAPRLRGDYSDYAYAPSSPPPPPPPPPPPDYYAPRLRGDYSDYAYAPSSPPPPPPPPPDYYDYYAPRLRGDYSDYDGYLQRGCSDDEMPKRGLKRLPTDFDRFDWQAFREKVANKFDVAAYVETHFSNPELVILDRVRNRFYCVGEKLGGGPFEAVCFHLYGHTQTRKNFSKILRTAAEFAGVGWPSFQKLGCTFLDVLEIARSQADNFTVIELSDGEYLSDKYDYNSATPGKVTHVIGGCGIGKTYASDSVPTKSFYTPMTRQAITFTNSANKRGATSEVVCEGYQHDGSPSIFGTYDAAKKEIALIKDQLRSFDICTRTTFFDEIQHMGHDAFRKASALEPLVDIAEIYIEAGSRVITLSGTPSPIYPALLNYEGSDVVVIKRKNQPKRKLYLFRQSDPIEAILDRISAGYTHITYSIDDKEKCEAIAKILTNMGHKALPIHSNNKNLDFHKQYTGEDGEDGEWASDVVIYVTTRATVDGFSVLIGDNPNVRLAEMFDATLQYGSQMIEQRSRRPRDYLADVFVGMSDKALEKLGSGGHFDYIQELNDELEIGHKMVEAARTIKVVKLRQIESRDDIERANEAANQYVLEQFKDWIRFDEDGQIQLDEISIIHRVTARWVAAAHSTPDIMINELESYGFTYEGLIDCRGHEAEAKEREEAIKLEKQARKEAELNGIKSQAETMSLVKARSIRGQASSIIREEEDEGRAKVAAAGLVIHLTEQGITENAARQEIAKLTSTRQDKIERIENVIRLAKIRRALSSEELFIRGDAKTLWLASLQNGSTFQFGEKLESREIVERVSAVADACGIPEIMTPLTRSSGSRRKEKRYDSDKKVMPLINDIYQLRRTSIKVDGEKTHVYEFQGFREIELSKVVAPPSRKPESIAPPSRKPQSVAPPSRKPQSVAPPDSERKPESVGPPSRKPEFVGPPEPEPERKPESVAPPEPESVAYSSEEFVALPSDFGPLPEPEPEVYERDGYIWVDGIPI